MAAAAHLNAAAVPMARPAAVATALAFAGPLPIPIASPFPASSPAASFAARWATAVAGRSIAAAAPTEPHVGVVASPVSAVPPHPCPAKNSPANKRGANCVAALATAAAAYSIAAAAQALSPAAARVWPACAGHLLELARRARVRRISGSTAAASVTAAADRSVAAAARLRTPAAATHARPALAARIAARTCACAKPPVPTMAPPR